MSIQNDNCIEINKILLCMIREKYLYRVPV